jgi:hypothetical protein
VIDLQLAATDLDSSDFTYSILLRPHSGNLIVDAATGAVRYQPNPGYVGVDSFLFRVCDIEGACDTGAVFIDVLDTNDPPVAAYLQTTINQAESTQLDARATDADEEPLTFSLISEPIHGSIISFDPATGAFTYISDDTYIGPDLIRFQACDAAGACDIGVIQLNIIATGGGGVAAENCAALVISEVAWAGTAAGEEHEWIELRNLESFPIELAGWTLRWHAIDASLPEARAWRILPLEGALSEFQPEQALQFEPNTLGSDSYWARWAQGPTADHYLIELGTDECVLPTSADLVWPIEDEFGLSTRLPEEGAILELIGPSGCLVDTANIERLDDEGWSAGSIDPLASMERTDLLIEDADDNWHTNLGLIRNGWDAFGNLLHGTPKVANSPILAEVADGISDEAVRTPAGEPIQLPFIANPLWSADPELWRVVITRALRDDVLPAAWEVVEQTDGSTSILVQSHLLPLNVPLYLWVRTPTGEVLLAPILLDPY